MNRMNLVLAAVSTGILLLLGFGVLGAVVDRQLQDLGRIPHARRTERPTGDAGSETRDD